MKKPLRHDFMGQAVPHKPVPAQIGMARSLASKPKGSSRQLAEQKGRQAERICAWWLRLKGWSILDRRVRTKVGEVDIIARRGNVVAFVEVKARSNDADLDHAIDEYRLSRVARAAEMLAPRYLRAGDDMQIDVMLLAPKRPPRHISNVWHGG